MIAPQECGIPVFEQKCEPEEQYIRLNVNYLCPLGFIRVVIILMLFAGNLSAWIIPYDVGLFYFLEGGFSSTRSAYIVLSSIAIGLSVFFFIISVTNYVNLPAVRSGFWLVGICFFDFLCMLAMLAVGIAASVREVQVPVYQYSVRKVQIVNQGAFASAGFFALFTAIWYFVSIMVSIPYLRKLFEPECCNEAECCQQNLDCCEQNQISCAP